MDYPNFPALKKKFAKAWLSILIKENFFDS